MRTAKLKINPEILKRLRENWGEKADAMQCYAELRLFDPLSSWCCYIYAMAGDQIKAVTYSNTFGVDIIACDLYDVLSMYNEEGEHPSIDPEFRRVRLDYLLKRLER